MNPFLSWCCKIILGPLVKGLFIKEVRGKENIPKRNFILAANHQSYLDIIFSAYLCVPRKFHFIGQIEGFRAPHKWFISALYFISGVIPLDRKDKHSRKKVADKAIEVLNRGSILTLYPEGKRSANGLIQEGKLGTARFFLKTGAPILPVGIKGTFELMPPGGKLRIKKIVELNVGKPLFFEKELARSRGIDEYSPEYKELLEKITRKMMIEISNLCQAI